MVKLITLLVAGIPALISAFLAFLARKWGTAAASIALAATLTIAFVAAINMIVNSLASYLSLPGSWVNAVGMFIPTNFGICLGAIVSAHIVRAAYDLAMEKTRLFNNAS